MKSRNADIGSVSSSDAPDTQDTQASTAPNNSGAGSAVRRKKKEPKPFNFKRPNKFNRDHFRAFQIVHETFARQITTIFSTNLRTASSVTLASVEEMSYGEFVDACDNPAFLGILQISPLPGASLWHMPMPLAMGIVERLLGGTGSGPYPERPLTDIESMLIRDLTDRSLREMTYSYESMFEVHAKTMQLESNPQFAQISAPSDMVLVVNFEMHIADTEGVAQLCIPYDSLASRLENMTSGHIQRDRPMNDPVAIGRALRDRVSEVPIEVSVTFNTVTMTGTDILELQVGDVVPLEHNVASPLTVKAEGVPHLLGKPGRQGKRLACQMIATLNHNTGPEAK